ncbi:GroES-like protein [Pholiota conissans]|uniref:GroES-like protein n=1 Tax=Pholiota conissans TaxID=109636 RepID=A0A9P5Z2R9_9AGAR|nr:GroES-like protein [Pholiota conissans]
MSPSASTAAVLYGPRDIRIVNRQIWSPTDGHAQVHVVSTGLCGSDLHYYTHGRNGDFAVRAPLVLGHESAGIVTAVSSKVSGLRVGQRVAIEAGISCRACSFCESGRYNLCRNMRFCSSAARYPHLDGTLQSRMNHPAHVLHPLPDDVSFELAALAEPLSVLIHASRRCALGSSPHPESVLVFGVGAIGLLACALAKHRGARRVVAVDINPVRLEFAKKNGFADDVYCLPSPTPAAAAAPLVDPCCSITRPSPTTTTSTSSSPASSPASSGSSTPSSTTTAATSIASSAPSSQAPSQPTPTTAETHLLKAQHSSQAMLQHFASPDGFDVVFECTGAESAIQMSIYSAITGGRVMLIGMGTRAAYIPVASFATREVDVRGSFRYAGTYAEALELLSESSPKSKGLERVDGAVVVGERQSLPEMVKKLVTHRFKLEDTAKAFEMLARGVDDQGRLVLKVIVEGEGVQEEI